ncbi:MAG: enoyl-CoA hydratase/isomerase family protein [Acidimicrobiales bacterium]
MALPSVDGLGLSLDRDGRVLRATIDRGDDNLMSMAMCEALTGLLLEPPEGCHVLHLRATGPNFCLGRDRGGRDVDLVNGQATTLVALNRALAEGELVTVAEVAGDAAGFGVSLAALCDASVAAPSARFWFPEIDAGLAPAVVLAWLPRMIGRGQAFHLTATGAKVDGGEAARIGLVTKVAKGDGSLAEETEGEIAALLSHPRRAHLEIRAFLAETAALDQPTVDRLAIDRLVLASLRLAAEAAKAADAAAGGRQ